jgi:hypothetical protein
MTTKLLAIALAAGLLVGTGASGFAQSPTSEKTPGAQMQDKGSVKGSPGASGYAPGHQKKRPRLSATAGGVMAIASAINW